MLLEERLTSRERLVPTPVIRKVQFRSRERSGDVFDLALIPRSSSQILELGANLEHAGQTRDGNGSANTPVGSHSPVLIGFRRSIELDLTRIRVDRWITECCCLKHRENVSFRVR